MAQEPYTLANLKAEIEVTNPGDYAGLGDVEVSEALAAVPSPITGGPFSVDVPAVAVADILDAIDAAAWAALTATGLQRLSILTGAGEMVRSSPAMRTKFQSLFVGQQATLDALNEKTIADGSRGMFLWGYEPTPSDVADARRL